MTVPLEPAGIVTEETARFTTISVEPRSARLEAYLLLLHDEYPPLALD